MLTLAAHAKARRAVQPEPAASRLAGVQVVAAALDALGNSGSTHFTYPTTSGRQPSFPHPDPPSVQDSPDPLRGANLSWHP